jgi:hypothetical protein
VAVCLHTRCLLSSLGRVWRIDYSGGLKVHVTESGVRNQPSPAGGRTEKYSFKATQGSCIGLKKEKPEYRG